MSKTILVLLLLFLPITFASHAQSRKDKKMLERLLKKQQDSLVKAVMQKPEKYHLQIIYTQIDRDDKNRAIFKTYSFGVDTTRYFYPASTVKLAAAAAALEKLNDLNIDGLNKYTPLRIDSAYAQQTRVLTDSSAVDNRPSVAHYIRKVFLVSDNDAFNRLYEFVGQERLNKTLHDKGYREVRLLHRLSVLDGEERARYTNPMTFYTSEGKIVYEQALALNAHTYSNRLKTTNLGNGYYSKGKLVNKPMDFSDKNYISLASLHGILQSLVFPKDVAPERRFNLTEEDYTFLYRYMSMLPRESDYPKYDPSEYYDSYVKFFMFGDNIGQMPENIRIFNKVGNAYGYMIDNAYVVDFDNRVEFLLSAVILANENMVFNSDDYQYETVALPFLTKLGQAVYQHELNRKRKYKPNLARYKAAANMP
ncbi:serine hydrolase [uncultured Pontibacter sp.]|uniref:serine hydrolase n=1 Tax=uncultured Pontibacter sp. TaxID=453356 RepID=UPI0026119168|nr:serine hydrolase [uncultured Pontibacter sp.]